MLCLIFFVLFAFLQAQTNPRPSNFSVYQFLVSQPINLKISETSRDIKFENMAKDTLSFYRGSPQLYSRDFIGSKIMKQYSVKDTMIWVCGDLHGANFGAFTNAKDDVIYELTDFDESLILDYQYDLYRLGTYIVLLGKRLGRPADIYAGWIRAFTTSYLQSIDKLSINDQSLSTSFTSFTTSGVLKKFLTTASAKSELDTLDSFTTTKSGKPNRVFLIDPDNGIATLESNIKNLIIKYWPTYVNSVKLRKNSTPVFAIKDIVRRVNAGLSSLGVERYYVLIEGETLDSDDDVILDVKMLMRPSSLNFFDKNASTEYERQWPRLVDEMSRINASIIGLSRYYNKYLGFFSLPVFRPDEMWPFYVNQRTPAKSEWKPKDKTSNQDVNDMATWWGTILATQHSRADRKFDNGKYSNNYFAKSVQVSAGRSVLIDLVSKVSIMYASQVTSDYNDFVVSNHLNNKVDLNSVRLFD